MASPAPAPDALIFPVSNDDHHVALTFTCVSVPLLALALATLITRISMKLQHGLRLGWDDYLLIIGCVRGLINYLTLII